MKFLLYEIIPPAGFNLATGRFWPAGRMFDTPALNQKRFRQIDNEQHNSHTDPCTGYVRIL